MEEMKMIQNRNTGVGLDMMAAMLPHVEEIVRDPEYKAIKEKIKTDKETTLADLMGEAFPLIAVKKRSALYGIVGAITGKTPEEIDAQPLRETLEVFMGTMGSDVLSFFTYCARLTARL